LIGRKPLNLIVCWFGRFLFFVVPHQFSQDIGEWPENQILIPDWTYSHCPGATLPVASFHWQQWIELVLTIIFEGDQHLKGDGSESGRRGQLTYWG